MPVISGLFILSWAAGAGLSPAAPELGSAPPLAAIIEGVIARDEATQKKLASMQFHESISTERIKPGSSASSREEVEAIVRPGAVQEVEIVSVKGDHLPGNMDQAQTAAQGRELDRQKRNLSLRRLATRYTIAYLGLTDYQGQPAYVLSFSPKPDQPYSDQTERVLNRLQGKLYISPRDYVLLKTEASLAEPVTVAWILATITSLQFTYELRSLDHAFGPAWVKTEVELRAPLFGFSQKQTIAMDRFEARPAPSKPLPVGGSASAGPALPRSQIATLSPTGHP